MPIQIKNTKAKSNTNKYPGEDGTILDILETCNTEKSMSSEI